MLSMFSEILNAFAKAIIQVLPLSPFRQFIDNFADAPYLGYLNWFIPITALVKIGTAWLVAIGSFYIYYIVLRWIRAID